MRVINRVNNSKESVYYFVLQKLNVVGRPTKQEEEKNRQKVIEFFCLGYSPSYIIEKTRLNKNTVYHHINKFLGERKSTPGYNHNLFLIAEKTILAYDKRLDKALEFDSQIEKQIKNSKNPQKHLLVLRTKTQQAVFEILNKKMSMEMIAHRFKWEEKLHEDEGILPPI